MAQTVKLLPAMRETWARVLGQEDPLEKEIAIHSSTLAWKIPWTKEPDRLQSMGSLPVWHDFTFTFTFHFHALEKEMATHSSVLAWRIPGTGEPGALPTMGSHRVRHDWSDLAAAAAIKYTWGILGIETTKSEALESQAVGARNYFKWDELRWLFLTESDKSHIAKSSLRHVIQLRTAIGFLGQTSFYFNTLELRLL